MTNHVAISCIALLAMVMTASAAKPAEAPRVTFTQDKEAGRIAAVIDGAEAFVTRHGDNVDLPYIVLNSPSGKRMTLPQPTAKQKYPHHRCFWFADTVQLEGRRKVSFYNAFYTRIRKDDPTSPFRDHIRHVSFTPTRAEGNRAESVAKLVWEMDAKTPVLDETRLMTVQALGQGEYLLDITFTVTASYGDVHFVSDAVHYAWPYLRMDPTFAVTGGGRITNSAGGVNQKGTHGKVADWVDYSNTVGGLAEGLTVFSHPANARPHTWLTRDYGTFGPRRAAARSGKKFTLNKGKSMTRRVGVLVHRGNVKAGKVAQRYAKYATDEATKTNPGGTPIE